MERKIIAIGGGELRNKTTLKIDSYIARLAKERAGENRATALFLGTASHDSLPYFNTFRKTYTGEFDIKADVAIATKNCMDMDKIQAKFQKADMLYVGGGDTVFMLDVWKQTGIEKLVLDAYNRGVILSGLSAGAICWFKKMYTDFEIIRGGSGYNIVDGLGYIDGVISPHYDERREDFKAAIIKNGIAEAYGVENNAAVEITDGIISSSLSAGGRVYKIINKNGTLTEHII